VWTRTQSTNSAKEHRNLVGSDARMAEAQLRLSGYAEVFVQEYQRDRRKRFLPPAWAEVVLVVDGNGKVKEVKWGPGKRPIHLAISKTMVNATARKLSATYTVELAQDMETVHGPVTLDAIMDSVARAS
jgi:hypothetical protein